MVLFQLRLVHLAGVLLQLRRKLHHIRRHVVYCADVRGTDHVIILALDSIVDQAVQLAAKQEVAHRALGGQREKAAHHALQGHVSVLVLLPVPPVQQEVRADLHHGKHRHLRRLAQDGPVPLLCRPLQLCLVRVAGVRLVPRRLRFPVAHRVDQDARILEALGREHRKGLYHLVRVALDACPLHHGVVRLGLLDHLLVGAVHGLPVCRAAGLARALEFRRVVLHIGFAALPQGRHRDLVHAVDPPGQPSGHLVHALLHQRLPLSDALQLAFSGPTLPPLQKHVPVLCNFRFQRRLLLRFHKGHHRRHGVPHKWHHRRHGVPAQHGRRRRQARRLCNGHAGVQGQHRPRVVAPQRAQHPAHAVGAVPLGGLQVGQQIVQVAHGLRAPLLLDHAVFQGLHAVPGLHPCVQDLLHVPDGRGQSCIGRRVSQAALHHA